MQIPGRLPSKYQVATTGSGHSNCKADSRVSFMVAFWNEGCSETIFVNLVHIIDIHNQNTNMNRLNNVTFKF